MKIHHSIRESEYIHHKGWSRPPFVSSEFFCALEESLAVGKTSGWLPRYLEEDGALLYFFSKTHSFGEYIFDWDWARAYAHHSLPYYPKLTSMVPFTPVTTPHFLMREYSQTRAQSLLDGFHDLHNEGPYSSAHFLFITAPEIELFGTNGYLIRESMQYHFFNDHYQDFENFLSNLKGKKAKTIRQERLFPDLKIDRLTGAALTAEHALEMYEFYLSTIDVKNSRAYLNREFFLNIFATMKESILYVRATRNDKAVAGALFFYDAQKLYGRYWGSHQYIQNLHFELCYYQGIEFAIEKGLVVFEAGAQGEHKISRGFRPVKTYSAHRLKNPQFGEAIARYIEEEKLYINQAISDLSKLLPFKQG